VQAVWAFNMAEKYQLPVILATDHSLSNRVENIVIPTLDDIPILRRKLASADDLENDYRRYKFTDDGVSPMAVPGLANGMHVAEGLEHNEYGNPNYTGENHEAMIRKRFEKIDKAWEYPHAVERFGDENPDLLVVTWGSTKGPVKEAVQRAVEEGRKVAYLVPKILCPLPEGDFMERIINAPEVMVVEMNFTGQLEGLLRKRTARNYHRLNKVQGSPVTWLEVAERIEAVLDGKATTSPAVHA